MGEASQTPARLQALAGTADQLEAGTAEGRHPRIMCAWRWGLALLKPPLLSLLEPR